MAKGVIVIGHGSRYEGSNEEFLELVNQLNAGDRETLFRAAFLSNGSPDLEGAVLEMLDRGIKRIVVMPVFLSAGSHVQVDIPAIIGGLCSAHPQLQIIQAEHIGAHPGLSVLIHEQIARASDANTGSS